MAYVSLYRKYRSQTFEDVMGQDHVTRTLQNAIRLGKISHAYLFCGTRGTGKTTTARLLAKALNCDKGPTPQPCNACPACVGINDGSAMDIVELDAASHTGIGDVRDINENVKFPPMELRYKVFIIDEAHQLSNDAKDAFLKTLEEPPSHAVFVLATTEPQSIPLTIRSRCQQFEFRRGSLRDIRERLAFVAEKEGVQVEPAALDMMAVGADGSWRDSLSLLEQVLAYTDGNITLDDVSTVLGMVTQDYLFRLTDALADGDECVLFEVTAEAVESGRDVQQLLRSLAQHFRNLLFALVTKDLGNVTTDEETAVRLREQASRFGRRSLIEAVDILTGAEREMRYSDQHRLLLELAMLRAAEVLRPRDRTAEPVQRTSSVTEETQPEQKQQEGSTPESETEETCPPPEGKSPAQQELPDFGTIEAKWPDVLRQLKALSVTAHALLRDAVPAGLRNGALVLRFKGEGQKKLFENERIPERGISKRQSVLRAIEYVFGVADAKIICEVAPNERRGVALVPPPDEGDDLPNPFEPVTDHRGEETLRQVLDMFEGEVVDE